MGALLIFGLVCLFVFPGKRSVGTYGLIESGGNMIRRVDLSLDQEVSVFGPLGATVVEVKNGQIRVKQSPCPHQFCVNMGFKEKDGDVIACIPNRVVVHVEGSQKAGTVNGVTR
ncbi:MAG: NusG domain II-containing protein [Gemmatimonadota bacterium]|nr:MAG: NusG domain II-containing protein [Gemmatimonadota bacterium]